MSYHLKIALFVEGADDLSPRDSCPNLTKIWAQQLPQWLGLLSIHRVIPISKKTLVALDPASPQMSGAGEALDQLLVRELARQDFDMAVVAWDLAPPWDPDAVVCRWQETVDLYRHLAASTCLGDDWLQYASERYVDLSRREQPNGRTKLPELKRGAILPICMTPEFERLLVERESLIREALGVTGKRIRNWPAWHIDSNGKGNTDLLQKAILAARRANRKADPFRRVRGDMRTAKNEWGSYFLRYIIAEASDSFRGLSTPTRLSELLGQHRSTR